VLESCCRCSPRIATFPRCTVEDESSESRPANKLTRAVLSPGGPGGRRLRLAWTMPPALAYQASPPGLSWSSPRLEPISAGPAGFYRYKSVGADRVREASRAGSGPAGRRGKSGSPMSCRFLTPPQTRPNWAAPGRETGEPTLRRFRGRFSGTEVSRFDHRYFNIGRSQGMDPQQILAWRLEMLEGRRRKPGHPEPQKGRRHQGVEREYRGDPLIYYPIEPIPASSPVHQLSLRPGGRAGELTACSSSWWPCTTCKDIEARR
jgi:hypothetical protein